MNFQHPTSNIELTTKMKKTFDLEERLLEYSTRILEIVSKLPKTREYSHIANQLLRSGTSAYPNHAEAQAAESAADFIHKMRISLKELRETKCWLRLINNLKPNKYDADINYMLQETEELIKIFVSSIKTVERNKLTNKR